MCNGCQFLSRLKELIPGAQNWPTFVRNISEQYEARVCMVEILDNPRAPSVFLYGMAGSKFFFHLSPFYELPLTLKPATLPIATAHGEGRASFNGPSQTEAAEQLFADHQVSLRYVDNYLKPTDQYPANPNGSPLGIAGVRVRTGEYWHLCHIVSGRSFRGG